MQDISQKMLQRLKQYFYWPGMNTAVYKKCESCPHLIVLLFKVKKPALHNIAVGEPFACIGVNLKKWTGVLMIIGMP